MLERPHDVPSNLNVGGESEYALKHPNETWTAKTIEPVFRELMFAEEA